MSEQQKSNRTLRDAVALYINKDSTPKLASSVAAQQRLLQGVVVSKRTMRVAFGSRDTEPDESIPW